MKINKKVMEGAAVVVFVMTITVTSVTADHTEPKSEPYTQEILLEDTAQAAKEKAMIDVVALALAEEEQTVDSAAEQSETAQEKSAEEKSVKASAENKEEKTPAKASAEDQEEMKSADSAEASAKQQEAAQADANAEEALKEEAGEAKAAEEKIDVAKSAAGDLNSEKAEDAKEEQAEPVEAERAAEEKQPAEAEQAAEEKQPAEAEQAAEEKETVKEAADDGKKKEPAADEAEKAQNTELNGKSQDAEAENDAKEETDAKDAAADNGEGEAATNPVDEADSQAEDSKGEAKNEDAQNASDEVQNEDAKDVAAEEEKDQPEAPVSEWATKLMPNVEEYLNVRAEANEEAELLGKLRRGDAADILERGAEWSKISSGNVEGYVKNEFCVFDEAAETMAYELGTVYATASTGGLRVRAEANSAEETEIVHVMEEGEKIKVDTAAEAPEGWVAVKHEDSGTTAYVSAEFVSVELKLGKAISIEEEREAIRRAEEEAAAKERERQAAQSSQSAQSSGGQTTQRSAVSASYDDVTLLGALIQCEAGGECYEGQVAVGAVVMNRLRRGYAGSISGVIYQSGQFAPASSGALARVLANGVSGSCLSAVQEAINGVDNVGGATSFRGASSGQSGIVIGNHVFY